MSSSLGLMRENALTGREMTETQLVQKSGVEFGQVICSAAMGTLGFALFIIGCVAAAGHLTSVVAGGCAVGLAVPLIIGTLFQALTSRNPAILPQAITGCIMMLVVVIIGSLGCAGVVTAGAVGWTIIIPTIIALGCLYCCLCCVGCAGCAVLGGGAMMGGGALLSGR